VLVANQEKQDINEAGVRHVVVFLGGRRRGRP
jgi:hypothetical protein